MYLYVYLRTNSDLCHLQYKLNGLFNRDEKCLLRGTDWFFKYSGLRFVFKGFICEQTATCATYSINWLVFITEMKSVYCAVRTGSLNKTARSSFLNGYWKVLNQLSPPQSVWRCVSCIVMVIAWKRIVFKMKEIISIKCCFGSLNKGYHVADIWSPHRLEDTLKTCTFVWCLWHLRKKEL